MKTILHIIDTTGPGGAETVFIDLASKLPKEKFRSIVVVRGKGWVYDELCRRGLSPIIMDAKGSFNWRYLLNLRRLIKCENVQLIQSHLLGSNIYSALAGILTRTPVIVTFHGMVDVGINERFKRLKFAAINLGASRIVAVSESLRDDIIVRSPIQVSKLVVIYNGVETESFKLQKSNKLRYEFGWDESDTIVGSLGNIRSAKAYDVLLNAAALLIKKSKAFKFLIAGQTGNVLFDNLLKLRAELELENYVEFIGFVDKPADFLSNLDIFLLTSSSEGFSIATIQAMAACKPVLATKSGGPEEIIDSGYTGLLVNVGVPKVIASELLKLAANKDQMLEMAEQAQQHVVNKFDISTMLEAYEKTYLALT